MLAIEICIFDRNYLQTLNNLSESDRIQSKSTLLPSKEPKEAECVTASNSGQSSSHHKLQLVTEREKDCWPLVLLLNRLLHLHALDSRR